MDLPAYMVGIGTLLAGAAGAAALIVRRGEREPDDHELADYWHSKYEECEAERAKAQPPPRTVSKRRKP